MASTHTADMVMMHHTTADTQVCTTPHITDQLMTHHITDQHTMTHFQSERASLMNHFQLLSHLEHMTHIMVMTQPTTDQDISMHHTTQLITDIHIPPDTTHHTDTGDQHEASLN